VGAGGIGLILSEQIRTLELQQMSFVILLILATVSLIDWGCARLRFSIIGARAL
jgi:phosphonate transport system permease protein